MTIPFFEQTVEEFFSSKSNWTGLTGIVTGIIMLYNKADTTLAVQAIFAGLALICAKDAIAK